MWKIMNYYGKQVKREKNDINHCHHHQNQTAGGWDPMGSQQPEGSHGITQQKTHTTAHRLIVTNGIIKDDEAEED